MHSDPPIRLLRLANYLLISLAGTATIAIIASTTGLYDIALAKLHTIKPTPMELNPQAIGGVLEEDQSKTSWIHLFQPSKPIPAPAPSTQPSAPLVAASSTPVPTAPSTPTPTQPPKKSSVPVAQAATKTYIAPITYDYISRGIIPGVHTGIDFVADTGTPVIASRAGTVIEADSSGWNSGWGKYILIRHADGDTTRYAHLSRILLAAGTEVPQGELIALSGSTGRSTGPHLHFEIRVNGKVVNPL